MPKINRVTLLIWYTAKSWFLYVFLSLKLRNSASIGSYEVGCQPPAQRRRVLFTSFFVRFTSRLLSTEILRPINVSLMCSSGCNVHTRPQNWHLCGMSSHHYGFGYGTGVVTVSWCFVDYINREVSLSVSYFFGLPVFSLRRNSFWLESYLYTKELLITTNTRRVAQF